MATMAQRIEALRNEKNLSRPALSTALGFPKNALEKFETGRTTPTKEQQEKLAQYFGVSLLYLKGESGDRTDQTSWMDGGVLPEEEPVALPTKPKAKAQPQSSEGGFHSFLNSKSMQELLRGAVLDVMRSPEGQEILGRVIRKELDKRG